MVMVVRVWVVWSCVDAMALWWVKAIWRQVTGTEFMPRLGVRSTCAGIIPAGGENMSQSPTEVEGCDMRVARRDIQGRGPCVQANVVIVGTHVRWMYSGPSKWAVWHL